MCLHRAHSHHLRSQPDLQHPHCISPHSSWGPYSCYMFICWHPSHNHSAYSHNPVAHPHCFISIRNSGAGSCFIGIGYSTPSSSLNPYCSWSFCWPCMSCVVRNALSPWRSEASGVGGSFSYLSCCCT